MDNTSLFRRIAVVGMDGIFPGALSLDAFWQNIIAKADQSKPVPPSRWIAPVSDRLRTTLAPDHPYSPNACLITDFVFDPDGFSLDPDITRKLDPVHQLTLTAGKRAVSRCMTQKVDYGRVDTILAAIALPTDSASAFSRKLLGQALEQRIFGEKAARSVSISRAEAMASRVDGLPAALLAAEMGFGGSAFTLDAACASSIYAVALACDALSSNRADMVVTGGVSRPECLYTQTGFSQLKALSASGRCAPFDAAADGLVVGEGVGILVLKRLEDAISHGDAILGVINGIGLSNDMRGNLLAPEQKGQVRAMQAAYAAANWKPWDVDLIECHGTGTPAGDTTEIRSLTELWADRPASVSGADSPCAIGSVKSMIGHLLTAAAAAGMIKVLLAMKHQMLPPSLHYQTPPPDSPLLKTPHPDALFQVQTNAAPWTLRDEKTPRRAAVSAFGFGGINGHILFAEWKNPAPSPSLPAASATLPPPEKEPVAIVGMALQSGGRDTLFACETAFFNGQTAIGKRPKGRWKGANAVYTAALDHLHPAGAFVDTVKIRIGEFQIPPTEIDSILPQQLLALKAGAAALADAGMALHEARPRMGVVMGMGFDFEATNFHLRWQLFSAVQRWRTQYGLAVMDEAEMDTWLKALRDGCGPPLTAPRVMGALGGIVASRMAREFRFGAPSFGICADAASGIHALQVAMDRLCHKEADAMLVGAVDLSGEGRNLVRMNPWLSLSPSNQVRPFDTTADGTLPGDGAVALVIKPLSAAQAAGDRIYAIIQGIGSAGGGNPITGKTLPEVYTASLSRCFASTDITPAQVSYIETHGSGVPDQDQMEQAALNAFFADPARDDPAEKIAIGSAKPFFGHTGIADGLVSLVKATLCLHRKILPALPGFVQSGPPSFSEKKFHVPQASQPWYQDRDAPPRTALVSTLTIDGACGHVLLQEAQTQTTVSELPDSTDGPGLFVLTGHTPGHLRAGLSELEAFLNTPDAACQPMARRWMRAHPADARHELAICLLMSDLASENQAQTFSQARQAIETGQSDPLSRSVFYTAAPMGKNARIAMVYPGSGNHYLGMGRDLGLRFPGIIARMAQDTARLKTQMRPWVLMPWEINWASGWRTEAEHRLVADPLNMIFGQVVYGDLMTRVLNQFSIPVHALIGYSLGETASLFAHGIWKDRGDMLFRMQDSDLFSTQLAGPCHALRNAWHIPDTDPVVWQVAVVNRPAEAVKSVISRTPHVRLLIVNTPDECVIAGTPAAMVKTISRLECKAIYLDGVITVHCDALGPVADTYRYLHFFPATPKPGLTVYSCGWAAPYAALTADTIADAIMKQAMDGFDFTQTIRRAYDDGITVFIETGPKGSCTRMINRILDGAPHHLAVTANPSGEGEITGLLRCLARLTSERVPLDLSPLYADDGSDVPVAAAKPAGPVVVVPVGGQAISPPLPPAPLTPTLSPPHKNEMGGERENSWTAAMGNEMAGKRENAWTAAMGNEMAGKRENAWTATMGNGMGVERENSWTTTMGNEMGVERENSWTTTMGNEMAEKQENFRQEQHPIIEQHHPQPSTHHALRTTHLSLMNTAEQSMAATAAAHQQFLDLSQNLSRTFAEAFGFQNQLLMMGARPASHGLPDTSGPATPPPRLESEFQPGPRPESHPRRQPNLQTDPAPGPLPAPTGPIAFDRAQCMEFAIGSVGRMLGPAFAIVDTHPVRVRLPDEPLMLVDRIVSVEGEMLSMTSGRVVTEHDVRPGTWYLDGDRAPVCISVEAGQADLFLSAWLGIDHQVKGSRAYRLLDAVVTFHRGLPRPGETIRYDIVIDRFVRQGDTWMFFFHYEGRIGDTHLITMRDGCAGFFTEAEVENSGGIILTEAERRPVPGKTPENWRPPVPMKREAYTDAQVDALRRGDLAGCFGDAFAGVTVSPSLRLPDGRMRLIHRIVELDPDGGRYGLGMIRAEADIHPDDWFLTCHFMDDPVMPGTLMYECCAHALRVFLQRMGWVSDQPGACYEPVIGSAVRLKCRGPVTPKTRHVWYELQISEILPGDTPGVTADAHMFADGRPIVLFKNMSMKMTGVRVSDIEAFWKNRTQIPASTPSVPSPALYDHASILAFATGNPSEAFGEPYRIFDTDRTIARLPGPPYCFMDRVVHVEPPPWVLKAGGWITAEYDVPATEWYFAADKSGLMPFCILLEIALQPCGWLAAYAGSALRSQRDLKFRNLGGEGTCHQPVIPDIGTLTIRVRMTKVSEAAEMIIEYFDFEVLSGRTPIYTGTTYFGFFSADALGQQKGLGDADPLVKTLNRFSSSVDGAENLDPDFPLTPDDAKGLVWCADHMMPGLMLPGKVLCMIDRIDTWLPKGDPTGLGYIRGSKRVDPEEWFFKAHFYQDPVCPGSLGLESFIQLLKFAALKKWPEKAAGHQFQIRTGNHHQWTYRGQVIQKNKDVVVEAVITHVEEAPFPVLRADGILRVDGLSVYKMENFELAVVGV